MENSHKQVIILWIKTVIMILIKISIAIIIIWTKCQVLAIKITSNLDIIRIRNSRMSIIIVKANWNSHSKIN